jgi:hypothetical protein
MDPWYLCNLHTSGSQTGKLCLTPTAAPAAAAAASQGRTHASSPLLPEDGGLSGVVWEAPLDIALTTSSSQHWPAIVFKLFHRSIWLGR